MDTSQLCKLFIGGLNVQTTEAGLRSHFEAYGSLTDCVVVVNPLTKRSRCFGFVTYADAEQADAAVAASPHVLDGNNVELKRAVSREDSSRPGAHAKVNKLFVGGLKADIEEAHLMEHFSQFGTVDKVEIIADKESGKKRGFGFIHFADHDAADKAAVVKFHPINGHRVEVKKAVPREEIQQASSAKSFRGGGRGRGGSANGFSAGREGYGGYEGYGGGGPGYSSYGGYGNGSNGFGNYSQHMSAYGPVKGSGAGGGGTWGRNSNSGPYGAGGYGGGGPYGSY
ncbi:PREDICTED: heterogeneous nuclear ribonucleoprotein A0 [Nanorana parkeri]|uniref:heterogeneous nuclear ribonucleoprotein A0 n=1 Tax=Nanorana parkeri TaxID=125878 RepID=UPI000854B442|nr:PREDICTED: heterogeneous nuclear ribonucleoprotein A0 [Nanorana parkeri]